MCREIETIDMIIVDVIYWIRISTAVRKKISRLFNANFFSAKWSTCSQQKSKSIVFVSFVITTLWLEMTFTFTYSLAFYEIFISKWIYANWCFDYNIFWNEICFLFFIVFTNKTRTQIKRYRKRPNGMLDEKMSFNSTGSCEIYDTKFSRWHLFSQQNILYELYPWNEDQQILFTLIPVKCDMITITRCIFIRRQHFIYFWIAF